MDQLKRVLAVLGAAFGSLALFYLVFSPSVKVLCTQTSEEQNNIFETDGFVESMGTDPAKPLQNRPFAGTAPTYTSST